MLSFHDGQYLFEILLDLQSMDYIEYKRIYFLQCPYCSETIIRDSYFEKLTFLLTYSQLKNQTLKVIKIIYHISFDVVFIFMLSSSSMFSSFFMLHSFFYVFIFVIVFIFYFILIFNDVIFIFDGVYTFLMLASNLMLSSFGCCLHF